MGESKTEWRAVPYQFQDGSTRWQVVIGEPALCIGLDKSTAHKIAAVNELEAALEFARPLVEKWCHYQGDTQALFDQYLGPVDAALAKARPPLPEPPQ